VLIKHDRMLNSYIMAVQHCEHWTHGNLLAAILPDNDQLTDDQADTLVSAYNQNMEVYGSFGFNGSKPRLHGNGLLPHLNRLNERKYKLSPAGKITVAL
jgi:hypothetical protein